MLSACSCLASKTSIHIVSSFVVYSDGGSPHESRWFGGFRDLDLIRQLFKSWMVNTQAVSCCLILPLWCLYSEVHFLRFQLLRLLIVHLRNGLLHAQVRLTRYQLSQFFTPTRYCSLDTEPIC